MNIFIVAFISHITASLNVCIINFLSNTPFMIFIGSYLASDIYLITFICTFLFGSLLLQ